MKKTAISIALLVAMGIPVQNYAQTQTNMPVTNNQGQVSLVKIIKKLGKSTNTEFFYSASDFKNIWIDESKINYSSLKQSLDYLKKSVPLDYQIQNNTVTLRKLISNNSLTENEIKPQNDTINQQEKKIEEVVVVGYGTQKKSIITGSVSVVKGAAAEGQPILSAGNLLQGLAPGVTVTTQTGAPGGDAGNIRIRGINSFGGSDTNPLVIIDGVAGNINDVDVNMIESISVLKDAASAAIYGSRAAGGVILITTKRAKGNKLTAQYRMYTGWQMATAIPKVTDGLTYMKVFNDASMNDNGTKIYTDEAINAFKNAYDKNPGNYYWQKAILQGSGFLQDHYFSLSAKSGIISVSPSFGYSNQEGIIKNTDFTRFVFRNNMDITPNDQWNIRLDMSFINKDRKQIADEGTVWNYLGRMPTNIPIYYGNNYSDGWVKINPVGFIENGGNRNQNNLEFIGNMNISYKPTDWLTLKGMVAPRYLTTNIHLFRKSVPTYYEDGTEAGSANTFTELTESARRQFYGTYQFQADAKKEFGKHSFELLAGASRETYNEKILSGYRRDFLYDNYEVLDAGADNETKDNGGAEYEWLLVSAFGRFNYNYNQKYLFEANVRYDGTSRFIGKNRWAVFPSFSAGWVVSRESFFENLRETISLLKFRGSWGKLGNQNISSSYYPFSEPLSLGSTSMNGVVYQTIQQLIMSNPDLKWEETTMSGVGVDLSLWRKLDLTFDLYNKKTDGILLRLNTSQLTGLEAPVQNAATVSNKGWEIGAQYNERWGDFKMNIGFNLSDVKNEIIDMKGQSSGTLLRQQVGSSVNSIYGFIADGLYQSQAEINAGPTQFGTLKPGDIRYKDIAGAFDANGNPIGDGKITDADRTIIGSTIPRYTYGFNMGFSYKGLKLSALIQGVGKVDGYLDSHYVIPAVNSSAVKPWQLDYWTPENTDAEFPRVSLTSTNNTQNSTKWMRSAAYMRLKNVQIGYELPKSFTDNTFLQSIYLYLNGQNLLTFTNFYEGYDPEINYNLGSSDGVALGGGNYYPQVKTFSFGIDVKF
ncbi:SusC/RagA family TonB-linked outer membrane protein [Chryseobacterium chendengshani]|uniref:SusC/RagA family TonB-linked outer membrane protein n=1 Tax=Chryseobacterium sp. LJ756 TaxID=2864113 RepID=UPI001C63D9A8|nr:SusC/RagA family TonB-linked outer membrane protein [Chryseobacterium sp. LJ756]MBW7674290.1 TonB-dependent receptor [Chryseobacterium sp. LJ756]